MVDQLQLHQLSLPANAHYYLTVDVFTNQKISGNQLAVFPDARSIPEQFMQSIAREFNFSETIFFLPTADPAVFNVRIFTPYRELPFAGHPTIGGAYVCYLLQCQQGGSPPASLVLQEGVGPVKVDFHFENGKLHLIQLTVAQLPSFEQIDAKASQLAEMLGILPDDLQMDEIYFPEVVSCGVPFFFIPVKNRDILQKIALNEAAWKKHFPGESTSKAFVFALDPEHKAHDARARMFAPMLGVPEDPATGSAASAFGGYLAKRKAQSEGSMSWKLEQGYEMGRPSLLQVDVQKENGVITEVKVGGQAVLISEGIFYL